MARRFLRAPYDYARDAVNYPAGIEPWSGRPKIVQPNDSILLAGITPDTPIAAEVANYLEAVHADALTVQNHAALGSWGHFDIPSAFQYANFILPVAPNHGVGAAANRAKIFTLLGISGPFEQAVASADLKNFELTVTSSALAGFGCAAADDDTTIFGGELGVNTCHYSTNYGVSWSAYTPGVGAPLEAAYYDGARYVVVGNGVTASAAAITGPWTNGTFGAASDHCYQIVGDRKSGGAATRLVMAKQVAATSHWVAAYSTDHGVSWATGHDFGAAQIELTYSEAWGLFIVKSSSGGVASIWASSDGAVWTLQRTTSVQIPSVQSNGLCALGYAIVSIVNRVSGSAVDNNLGVAYSFDLGFTWFETYFGRMTGETLTFLTAVGGRLYALGANGDRKLYISGLLETPPVANYSGA